MKTIGKEKQPRSNSLKVFQREEIQTHQFHAKHLLKNLKKRKEKT